MKLAQIAVMVLGLALVGGVSIKAQQTNTDEAVWKKVDQMDTKALEKFLADYPNGKNAKDAKFDLALHKKIENIRSGKEKSLLVIPFEKLGDRWKAWEKRSPEKGAVGIYRNKESAGIFAVMGRAMISSDYSGKIITPTGDGSILAIRTDGLDYRYIGDIVFQSEKDDTLYFGVIQGKGLMHLSGKGKVTMPDGKETILK